MVYAAVFFKFRTMNGVRDRSGCLTFPFRVDAAWQEQPFSLPSSL